jgi:hypothetical protein
MSPGVTSAFSGFGSLTNFAIGSMFIGKVGVSNVNRLNSTPRGFNATVGRSGSSSSKNASNRSTGLSRLPPPSVPPGHVLTMNVSATRRMCTTTAMAAVVGREVCCSWLDGQNEILDQG